MNLINKPVSFKLFILGLCLTMNAIVLPIVFEMYTDLSDGVFYFLFVITPITIVISAFGIAYGAKCPPNDNSTKAVNRVGLFGSIVLFLANMGYLLFAGFAFLMLQSM